MSQKTLEYTRDCVQWWAEHKAETGDVNMRIARLEKAVSLLLDALSFYLEDIHDLEGRPKEALGRRLWTPGGMSFTGDPRKFG